MSEIRHLPEAVTASRAMTSGMRVSAHFHDESQIVYASSGVVTTQTREGVWIAPPTRALWIPARVVHDHCAYGIMQLHLVAVPSDLLGPEMPAVLEVSPLLREVLVRLSIQTPSGERSETALEHLQAVLHDEVHLAGQRPLHLTVPIDERLRQITRAFDLNPADDRSLDDFATVVHTSSRTLSRLFRNELGTTFPRWRTQIRLYHALLLLSVGHNVTTTGSRCGWSTTSSFVDAFRHTFGRTPGQYRASATPTPG